MSIALRQPMSLEAFLEWERGQDLAYEFDGFEPVAMTGGSVEHSEIATNIAVALRARLHGKPCRVIRGDVKILAAGRVRYPNAVVTCTPIAAGSDILPEPVVVFEVLSPSTAGTDRIAKNEEYRATPSILHYVMLEQTTQAATMFSRVGDDWVGHVHTKAAILAFPEIGVELPLALLYEGIAFPPDQ